MRPIPKRHDTQQSGERSGSGTSDFLRDAAMTFSVTCLLSSLILIIWLDIVLDYLLLSDGSDAYYIPSVFDPWMYPPLTLPAEPIVW